MNIKIEIEIDIIRMEIMYHAKSHRKKAGCHIIIK